jgi:hypothetical protein
VRPIIVVLFAGAAVALALAVRSVRPTPSAPANPAIQASSGQTFDATWSVSGQRQTLMTGAARPAATVQLSGGVSVTTGAGLSRGFRGEVIGFDDGAGLFSGRVVWTDERGDRLFSLITGESLSTAGSRVNGTITGGTGRYAGFSGEYSFRWQYLIAEEANHIDLRAVDLRGTVRGGRGQ